MKAAGLASLLVAGCTTLGPMPGVVAGARLFGQNGDTPGELDAGYRKKVSDGVSLAAGRMPLVKDGMTDGSGTYATIGLLLTLGLGAAE